VTIPNPNSLPAVKQGLFMEKEAEKKNSHLDALHVRQPLVVSISQRSKELRLYNLVENLTISNPRFKSCIFKCLSSLKVSFFFWG
jgi:hypothetical protein